MDIYKQAARLNLRFPTSGGDLTVGQLFSLTTNRLTRLIKSLKSELNELNGDTDGLDFLDTPTTPVNSTLQLKFDIAKDVYLTVKAEKDAATNAREIKEHNQKILAIIKQKQDESLESMDISDLEKMLK